jgi:hypothetical protein
MKAMLTGFAVMISISIGAYFVLNDMGFSSADVGSGDNVRLD